MRDVEFEALLLDVPPAYAPDAITISSRNAYVKFQDSIKNYLSRTDWAQTLFIIGGLGVGKTMFLRRFFTLPATTDGVSRDACTFFIDFRKPGLDTRQIPDLVYQRILDQILSLDEQPVPGDNESAHYDLTSAPGLEQVFWSDVRRFQKLYADLADADPSEYQKRKLALLQERSKDSYAYVRGAIRTLRQRYHRNVCVILDNADQCPAEYQEAVYLYSRTLEEDLRCLIIVSLREEWYWRFGRRGGPLESYHDVVYHIPAPRARDVLAKRLDYAITLADTYRLPPARASLGNVVLEAKHLAQYLRICRRAFFENDDISLFFESLSNGSVRKGLNAFLEYIRSGHTHVDEYLKAFVQNEDYHIQFHQVFRPVACGNYKYYSSERSLVPNPLVPVRGVSELELSFMTRAYFLFFLISHLSSRTSVGVGYVTVAHARSVLLTLGLRDEHIRVVLEELFEAELIEPDIKMLAAIEEWTHIRITAWGSYLMRRMIGRFAYIEALMLDTPLTAHDLSARLAGLYGTAAKPSLTHRLRSVREFLQFLSKTESRERIRVQSAGLEEQCAPFVPRVEGALQDEFDRIEQLIARTPFTDSD